MLPRRRGEDGRFVSNFEANRLDAIETPLPESDEEFELAGERDDEMTDQTGEPAGSDIPDHDAEPSTKVVQFKIEATKKENIKNWKSLMKRFLTTQGCWEVVDLTLRWQKSPEKIQQLLRKKGWNSANAMAMLYIMQNISENDMTSIRDMVDCGAMWAYLSKYEKKTHVDIMYAIEKMAGWKKDSKMNLEDSLQQLEQLRTELADISGGKITLDELVTLYFFLKGLPKEYETIKFAIMGGEKITREIVLSRLLQQESILSNAMEVTTGSHNETANRAVNWTCFNCGEKGHKRYNGPKLQTCYQSINQSEHPILD